MTKQNYVQIIQTAGQMGPPTGTRQEPTGGLPVGGPSQGGNPTQPAFWQGLAPA
jgi:hypothetical protein